jgi:hypothetical protein
VLCEPWEVAHVNFQIQNFLYMIVEIFITQLNGNYTLPQTLHSPVTGKMAPIIVSDSEMKDSLHRRYNFGFHSHIHTQ